MIPAPRTTGKNPGCIINDTDINTTLAFRRGTKRHKTSECGHSSTAVRFSIPFGY